MQLLSIKERKLEMSLEGNKQKRAIWQDPSRSIAADPWRTEAQCTLLAAFTWSWIRVMLRKATLGGPASKCPFKPAQRGFFHVHCRGFLLGVTTVKLSPSSQCSLTEAEEGGTRPHFTPVYSDEELGERQNS